MTKETNTQPKETRLRPGPKTEEAVADGKTNAEKAAMLEDIITRSEMLEQVAARSEPLERELQDARNQLGQMTRFDSVFAQINTVLGKMVAMQEAHSALMLARYQKLDRMHMRTRMLIGAKVTTGAEREKVFESMDEIITTMQAHVDALELTDAQKQRASNEAIARMQQLLTEAGAYENGMDQQLEMSDLEPGGHER